MKSTYETPSLVVEKFDLKDAEIMAGSIYSDEGEGNPYARLNALREF